MMGQSISQRSSLTANNGTYYIDTTVGLAKQQASVGAGNSVNVFEAGKTYYVFLLFAKPTTKQTYRMFVGKDPSFSATTAVSKVRASVDAPPVQFSGGAWPTGWQRSYDPTTGLLTVSMDMSIPEFQTAYAGSGAERCRPFSFCAWSAGAGKCQCALSPSDPLYGECTEKNARGDDAICSWAVKDFDCPSGGCFGFAVTLSAAFATDPAVNPRPAETCFPNNATWNVDFAPAASGLSGACATAPIKKNDFCTVGRPRPPRPRR